MSRECSDVQDEVVLRAQGYRKTPQRLLILSVLQAAQTRLTIWQILERVHEQSPGVTYQAVRGRGEEHYLVCQRCHRIITFASDQLPALARQLEAQHCFHEVNAATIACGYCDECWPLVRQP